MIIDPIIYSYFKNHSSFEFECISSSLRIAFRITYININIFIFISRIKITENAKSIYNNTFNIYIGILFIININILIFNIIKSAS